MGDDVIILSTVRPQVSVPHTELVVTLGEEAVFECQASGDPAPKLAWRRLNSNDGGTTAAAADSPAVKSDDTANRSTFKVKDNKEGGVTNKSINNQKHE